MQTDHLRAVASDLEHGLVLVRELVGVLQAHPDAHHPDARVEEILKALRGRTRFMELPTLLLRAHAEIGEAMGSLRVSREMLEAQAIGRLRATHGKLSEVNSTAETAAMAIMSGVDEALALVEEVHPADDAGRAAQDKLRDGLMNLYNHLQFQDITSQQIQGVAAQLNTIESRLTVVAGLFDPGAVAPDLTAGELPEDSAALAYNPDAVFQTSGSRQGDVDALLAGLRTPAA